MFLPIFRSAGAKIRDDSCLLMFIHREDDLLSEQRVSCQNM